MREHDLQPRLAGATSRRPTAITTSPIFPNRAQGMIVDRSRPALGRRHHLCRDAGGLRLRRRDPRCLVAPRRRLRDRPLHRRPADGRCAEGGDRASRSPRQAAFTTPIAARNTLRKSIAKILAANGLVGSMGRRGNPYDNAKAESFMKTLKVEAVYPMAYETFVDVAENLPTLHRRGLQQAPAPLRARLSEPPAVRGSTHPADGQISSLTPVRPQGPKEFLMKPIILMVKTV